MMQCKSCGGVYDPEQDGIRYFHACPPVEMLQVRTRSGALAEAPLADFADVTVARSAEDAATLIAAGAEAERVVVEVKRWTVERPNKRDENIAGRYADHTGADVVVLMAEGAGAVDVPVVDTAAAADAAAESADASRTIEG